MSHYNSALFNTDPRLELCGVKLTEAELLEKTFCTLHASNIVLRQQYRYCQFKKYLELISMLLTAEQTNELLLKNHDLMFAGTFAVPEAHAKSIKGSRQFRGRGRKSRNFRRMAVESPQILESTVAIEKCIYPTS